MIQDSHVVALHISLRCVEVAATMRRSCVGLSCICATLCNTTGDLCLLMS